MNLTEIIPALLCLDHDNRINSYYQFIMNIFELDSYLFLIFMVNSSFHFCNHHAQSINSATLESGVCRIQTYWADLWVTVCGFRLGNLFHDYELNLNAADIESLSNMPLSGLETKVNLNTLYQTGFLYSEWISFYTQIFQTL